MLLGLLNPHAPRGKLLAVVLVAAWTSIAAAASLPSEQAWRSQKSFNRMPCSMTYVSDAYPSTLTPPLAQHNGLADVPDSSDLCKGLTNDLDVLVLLESHGQLVGECSHRRLVYSMKFGNSKDTLVKFLDGYDVNLVIIESLPSGVFVDPFELHHFVERKDTNLELPSALSNWSAVEIHFDLKPSTSMNCDLVMELPLHARYQPLDASGYATVEFGSPDLLLRYRRKETHPDSCLWVLQNLDATPVEKAAWRIPCGDEAHTGFFSDKTKYRKKSISCMLGVNLSVFTHMHKKEIVEEYEKQGVSMAATCRFEASTCVLSDRVDPLHRALTMSLFISPPYFTSSKPTGRPFCLEVS